MLISILYNVRRHFCTKRIEKKVARTTLLAHFQELTLASGMRQC